MEQINIKDFKGMNLKEGLWQDAFSSYTVNFDFYGLQDDIQKYSIPGVLQKAMSLSAMGQAAGVSAVTNIINDFTFFPRDSRAYGIDINSTGKVYRYDVAGSAWTWVSAITVSGQGTNIATYNNNVYYATNNYLGQYDGTNGNANFQQFSSANIVPRPMKVFAGSLFIGNGRYIDKYDGSTYASQKLALPFDFVIRSFEIYKDYLFVSADNGQYSRIFMWDGSSPTYNEMIPMNEEKFAPSLITAQGLLWIIGNRGVISNAFTFGTPIYIFDGTTPQLLFNLPIRRDSTFSPTTGLASYQNGILIGSTEGSLQSNTYETGVAGAWFIGKDIATGLFHASDLFSFRARSMTLGGIFSSGITQVGATGPAVYIAVDDTISGNNYGVYQVASPQFSPQEGDSIWCSLPMDAGSTNDKSWVSIKTNFDALVTGQSIQIQYRLNDATSWTTLKNYAATDPANDRMQYIPIGRTSRTISIRFNVTVTTSVAAPRIHSFSILYEPTGN